ncbi:MAG: hypothetical protein CME70_10950 [Halobacteriovorax sp.]|nr:hypothetical protein [Halobacteriovorax sp.]
MKLTGREIELFHFLFKYKLGGIKQINQFCYPTSAERCLRKRLNKIEKLKLIERSGMPINKRYQMIYQLTKLGMAKLSEIKSIKVYRNQLKSNSKEHDMYLIYIAESLKRSKSIKRYVSENELQCIKSFSNSTPTQRLVEAHSDGHALIKRGKFEFNAAIEYENSANGCAKYEDLVFNYYLNSSTSIVLFFTKHEWIKNFIFKFEQEHYTDATPKFYIHSVENEFGMIKNLTFQNRKGQNLNL